MIIVALAYIFVIPLVKNTCYRVNPCAYSYNCICQEKTCTCDYVNENNEIKKIECSFPK